MAKKKDIEAVNSVETKKKPLTEKAADKEALKAAKLAKTKTACVMPVWDRMKGVPIVRWMNLLLC